MKSTQLRKYALWLDLACLVVAFAVLYCGSNELISLPLMMIGALVALVLLVVAIVFMVKSRRAAKSEIEAEIAAEEAKVNAEVTDNEPDKAE